MLRLSSITRNDKWIPVFDYFINSERTHTEGDKREHYRGISTTKGEDMAGTGHNASYWNPTTHFYGHLKD